MTDGRALSDEDAADLGRGLADNALRTIMAHAHAIEQSLMEDDWEPVTPSQALRDAANYFIGVDVRLTAMQAAYVYDFLNIYADQLEDCAD